MDCEKHFLVFIALWCVSIFAFADSQPREATLVDRGGYYVFDLSAIATRDQKRYAWMRIEYHWDHYLRSNESYRSALVLAVYDCEKRQRAIVSETLYQGTYDTSREVRSVSNNIDELTWLPVRANTIEVRQLEFVCALNLDD